MFVYGIGGIDRETCSLQYREEPIYTLFQFVHLHVLIKFSVISSRARNLIRAAITWYTRFIAMFKMT